MAESSGGQAGSRAAIYFLIVSSTVLAIGAFGVFGVFLWRGPFPVLQLDLTFPQTLGFDAILALAFFAQHSGMVRRSFRARLARWIPADYHPVLYTLASGVVLLAQPLLWQPTQVNLLRLEGPLRWLVRIVFLASVAGVVWAIASLKHFDAVGAGPLLARFGKPPAAAMPLTIRGPYRWVRHPIYSSSILMVWATPDLTADRLLFNVLWSVWMVAGTRLEERDLVADFGEGYRDYQRRVGMLVPHSFLPRM